MSEKFRENLYHEPDAYFVPAGCEGEETDLILRDAGVVMTMEEGVPLGELDSPLTSFPPRQPLWAEAGGAGGRGDAARNAGGIFLRIYLFDYCLVLRTLRYQWHSCEKLWKYGK